MTEEELNEEKPGEDNPGEGEAGAKKKPRRSFKWYLISSLVLALAVFICLYVAVSTLVNGYTSVFGYSMFRVVTGSMEPTIEVGAVLLCESTDIEDIRQEDIICFRSRESSHYGSVVTHRVKDVLVNEDGEICLESRGDANPSSDPYYVQRENLIGRVVWHTGEEGFFTKMLSFLSGKFGFMVFIAVPVLVIAGLILSSVAKNIRGELNTTLNRLAKDNKKRSGGQKLAGYDTLTTKDYDELYEKLKAEMRKELDERVEGSETTEYQIGSSDRPEE